ncbi:unnamed protein product [Withania somnifera]
MSMPCECEKELPPEKKLKLEAEGEAEAEAEAESVCDLKVEDGDKKGKEEFSGYDSDDWETWPNKEEFAKYFEQVYESEGFEFDKYPGSCMYTPIYPILIIEELPELFDRIKGYASMAIKQFFGDDGKERKLMKILRLNAGGPRDATYYITFKIDNEGKEEIFQAKVELPIGGQINFPILRRKD